jgi:hypothetical protein
MRTSTLITALLLSGVCSIGTSVVADQPQPVVRKIAFLNQGQNYPDFLSEDSIAVIAIEDPHGPNTSITIFEYDENGDGILTGWSTFGARIVTKGGEQYEGVFLYESTADTPTPPPVGSHTLTGPDGGVLYTEAFGYLICEGTECTSEARFAGAWHLYPIEGDEVPKLIVLEALFSR